MTEPLPTDSDEPVMGLVTPQTARFHDAEAEDESPGEERAWGVNVTIGFTRTMSRRS